MTRHPKGERRDSDCRDDRQNPSDDIGTDYPCSDAAGADAPGSKLGIVSIYLDPQHAEIVAIIADDLNAER